MVRLNRVIDRLENGKPAVGTWANNGNLDDLAFATDSGYDYVFIDNEHTGLGLSYPEALPPVTSKPEANTGDRKPAGASDALRSRNAQRPREKPVGPQTYT